MMKKYYETPKMEIVLLEAEDVIRTSGDNETGDNETPILPIGEADELDLFEHHDLI